MNLNGLMVVLAQAAPAGAPAGTQQQAPPAWTNLIFFGLIGIMLYFVMIRPQTKKAKEQAAMVKTMKPGDKVATSSGIVGTVVSVKDKTVAIRSAESKLEVYKSAITEIVERSGDSGKDES
jgi:preprotein translocase subunit YajC